MRRNIDLSIFRVSKFRSARKVIIAGENSIPILDAASVIPICRESKLLESLSIKASSGARLPRTP